MPVIFDAKGQTIRLGQILGRGGEGNVFEVANDAGLVAKLYHSAPSPSKRQKILAMSSESHDERLTKVAAWPLQPLFGNQDQLAGFMMRKIAGFKEAHNLYSPKSRRTAFPKANWPFILHASANIAKAFAAMHERGHVIGDVNHGNVLLSSKATAMLIDCDSFQVRHDGQLFYCEVGVSTYTPPELQGKAFAGIERTANHDNFGLAVLVFHLLFMGRHPFAGRYTGPEDMTIERAIARHLFAYSKDASVRRMSRPPNTLGLTGLTPRIATLFEQAFSASTASARPTSLLWVNALEEMAREVRKCSVNHAHHYLKQSTTCPWCEIEKHTGTMLFGLPSVYVGSYAGIFNLSLIWGQITAIAPPMAATEVPNKASLGTIPTHPFTRRRFENRARKSLGIVLMCSGGVVWGALDFSGAGLMYMGILLWAGYALNAADPGGHRAQAQARIKAAEGRIQSLEAEWKRDAGVQRFDNKLRELTALRSSYQGLAVERTRRLRQLEDDRKQDQLRKFLDMHYLTDAKIPGVGPSRIAMLGSYGIETAADITWESVDAVPGFGNVTTSKLLAWRHYIEQHFVFDPRVPVDQTKINKVETELQQYQAEIEKTLRAGASELIGTKNEVLAIRARLTDALARAYAEVSEARAEF